MNAWSGSLQNTGGNATGFCVLRWEAMSLRAEWQLAGLEGPVALWAEWNGGPRKLLCRFTAAGWDHVEKVLFTPDGLPDWVFVTQAENLCLYRGLDAPASPGDAARIWQPPSPPENPPEAQPLPPTMPEPPSAPPLSEPLPPSPVEPSVPEPEEPEEPEEPAEDNATQPEADTELPDSPASAEDPEDGTRPEGPDAGDEQAAPPLPREEETPPPNSPAETDPPDPEDPHPGKRRKKRPPRRRRTLKRPHRRQPARYRSNLRP